MTSELSMGEADAGLAEGRRSVELDPLSSERNAFYGMGVYFARHYEEAIKQLRTTMIAALHEAHGLDEGVLGRTHAGAGDRAEAARVLEGLE